MMHAPTKYALEEIEDGDDDAPRPFNSVEFEDESKSKVKLFEEPIDEDDVPPLPFTFSQQRDDSLSESAQQVLRPENRSATG